MNTLQIRLKMHNEKPLSIAAFFSSMLLFIGLGGSLSAMFELPITSLTLGIGLSLILLGFLLRNLRFGHLFSGFLAIFGMVFGLLFADLGGGFYGVINSVSSVIGAHIGRNLARYSASDSGMAYALCYLSGSLALVCVWLVKNRCSFIAAIIGVLLALLDLCIGITASDVYICIAFVGILLSIIPERKAGGGMIAWLSLAIVMLLCIAGGLFFFEKKPIPHVSELRAVLTSTIREKRFGGTDSLPFGNFAQLASLEQTDEPMLEVTMDKPESLYLRGFVGSVYTGEGWTEAAKTDISDGANLFYWLHQDGFYGQTQLANAALLLDDECSAEDSISISIRHIGASREYVYAPYELLSASDELIDSTGIGDIQPYSLSIRGADGYELTSLPNQVKRYTTLLSLMSEAEVSPNPLLESYLIDESHYNNFIYAHFLDVPEDVSALLVELFGERTASEDRMDYGSAKQLILTWFEENIKYSENIAPHIQGNDFLTEFLVQTRTGYDVHYATAAVMMMRYFGVPARYVEGYLITPDAAENAEADSVIALNGSSGHAWCEIYQDGLGWIPFEVAPKYLNLMEQADILFSSDASDMPEESESEVPPPQENSLDMEEDFYDDFDDEDDEEETALPSPWSRIAGILLLIVFLALLIVLLRRRIALSRLKRSFKLRDRKMATMNLYAYLFSLMCEIYQWYDCNAPSGFTATLRADLGEDIQLKYQEVVRICELAGFDVRGVSESDYRFVYAFVNKTAKLLSKRAGGLRRLYLRYIRNLI